MTLLAKQLLPKEPPMLREAMDLVPPVDLASIVRSTGGRSKVMHGLREHLQVTTTRSIEAARPITERHARMHGSWPHGDGWLLRT